ncbi:hypothetical protein PFDSM3638_01750 [Pyrococcus furiosus DSM 3638]|uniref:Uncharacterized protein n=3 Tax=Pyrococcus furiosus TaxID=2261 RepID=A0A5C0XME4_PYRFU|nr:hypothetical protein [Pyrococcus furiosus]AAL80505.1 hypothetical protein PF0381 [Pyrococcus furiosus DSM 3638]AFN03145.1 hypothetical protein PFC_00860 [Pyrococcus furiosus COM1]QEK78073.1 hypothetical protein PFDSM3638_01750 [Pyrococcus furiosus DSM 3638]
MRTSKLAVKLLKSESGIVYYDPIYHGRTLKIIGIDNDPIEVMEYLLRQYKEEKKYSIIVFDTSGEFPTTMFEKVVRIEEGRPAGLDPLKMAKMGIINDPYSAVTIVQTIYELDRALTDKLYADFIAGKVNSIEEALKAKKEYSEVIAESYTDLDGILFSGDPIVIPDTALIDLSGLKSITLTGIAFLVLAVALENRRNIVFGLHDFAVLGFTPAGSAAVPLLTRPARRRVAIVGTKYALDFVLSTPGPTLVLYNDPEVQSMIYESQGVPSGFRSFVYKGEGAYIWRSPETVNVEFGKLLSQGEEGS